MLPKSKRVTGKDFRGLKTRIVYRGACFDIAASPKEETKFACVISKKRIQRAVDRNKAKRKVYTALQGMEVKHPSFFIVYPTKTLITIPFLDLKKELQEAFATL